MTERTVGRMASSDDRTENMTATVHANLRTLLAGIKPRVAQHYGFALTTAQISWDAMLAGEAGSTLDNLHAFMIVTPCGEVMPLTTRLLDSLADELPRVLGGTTIAALGVGLANASNDPDGPVTSLDAAWIHVTDPLLGATFRHTVYEVLTARTMLEPVYVTCCFRPAGWPA